MEITASDQRKASLKLVGMPQPATVGDAQHSMGTGLASSEEAAALNTLAFPALADGIATAQPATIVVEELDAEDEDPFTLDSFESLIRAHTAAGKDFILARVITREDVPEGQAAMETGQPRIFTSIYQAHQANRILFRTQPEEGLLHRMKAKNPLNNLPIVGDVHYYRVIVSDPQSNPLAKPVTISRMQAPAKNEDVEDDGRSSIAKSTSVLERSSTRVSPLRRDRVHLPRAGSTTSSDCSEVIPRRRHHHRRASSATLDRVDSGFDGSSTSLPVDNAPTRASSALLNHRHHEDAALLLESECSVCALMDASNNVHQHLCTTQSKTTIPSKNATMAPGLTLAELRQIKEELKRSKLPLTFTAHFFASDDDYLMTRSVREYFKANALAHEDIFIYTLYPGPEGESRVSDPTNPAARAQTMEEAIRELTMLSQEQRNSSSDSGITAAASTPAPSRPTTATLTHRMHRSRASLSDAFQRLRMNVGALFSAPNTGTATSPVEVEAMGEQRF